MAMVLSCLAVGHCHLTKTLEGYNKKHSKTKLSQVYLFVTHIKELLRTFPILWNSPSHSFNSIYNVLLWQNLLGALPELAARCTPGKQHWSQARGSSSQRASRER